MRFAGYRSVQRCWRVFARSVPTADLPRAVFLCGVDALHPANASVKGLNVIHSHDRHFPAAAGHVRLRGIPVVAES